MATLLRSGNLLKIFSGFRRTWATSIPRRDVLTLQNTHTSLLHTSVVRSVAVQRRQERFKRDSTSETGINQALHRINRDVRNIGRIPFKDVQDVYQKLKWEKIVSSTDALLLLRCCGSLLPGEKPEVRNKFAEDIWATLQDLQVTLDISHYNTLLRVYVENNHKFSPTQFLTMLNTQEIQPNRVTYQRFIEHFCQEGNIDGATKILEYMKEEKLPIVEGIFHALIMGHSRAKDMESAHEMLDVMRSAGLPPTSETYVALMTGYVEAGDIAGMERTLEECLAEDLVVDDGQMMEIILVLAQGGHNTQAIKMIEGLQISSEYKQDALNLILRLLNSDLHQMAYLVYRSIPLPTSREWENRNPPPVGTFFIRQLVRSGTDIPTIVHYCNELKREGLNQRSLEVALEAALYNEKDEVALGIMRLMAEDGVEVRPHYFWPIFVHLGKLKDSQRIYDVISEMKKLEVYLTSQTFEFFLPCLLNSGESADSVVAELLKAGVPWQIVVNNLVGHYLNAGDIGSAVSVVKSNPMRLRQALNRNLAHAYVRSLEAGHAITILGQIMNRSIQTTTGVTIDEKEPSEEDGREEEIEGEEVMDNNLKDTAGLFLQRVITLSKGSAYSLEDLMEPLLKNMIQKGLSISSGSGEEAKNRLMKANISEKVLQLIDTLVSKDLTYQPMAVIPYSQQSLEKLESVLLYKEERNQTTPGFLTSLLLAKIRAGDKSGVENLKKKLEDESVPLNEGVYALLIGMYVDCGDLEAARSTLTTMGEKYPDSRLVPNKFLRLAALMTQQGLYEEAAELIENQSPENPKGLKQSALVHNLCREVLNGPAEKGDVAAVQRIVYTLIGSKVVQPCSPVLGQIIRAYLANDDLDGALKEFELMCQKHKLTPFKTDLTKKCIMLEDSERLQKILSLSIEVHGEVNSLYDMAFSFIEADRVIQAKNLLKTPGLRANNNKLNDCAKRYLEMGNLAHLENLVAATSNIFDIDHDMMFLHLLRAYMKNGDCDRALELWVTMQEKTIEPSPAFLQELGTFLEANDRKVPFTFESKPKPTPVLQKPSPHRASPPPSQTPPSSQTSPARQTPRPPAKQNTPRSEFLDALSKKDFTAAFELKTKAEESGSKLSVTESSHLVSALLLANKLKEASGVTQEMLVGGERPTIAVLQSLLRELAKAGDSTTLIAFQKYMEESLQWKVNFSNHLANCYIGSGQWEELVSGLRQEVREASDSQLLHLAKSVPKASLLALLRDIPESLENVTSLSEDYAARGYTNVANMLWMHHFADGSQEEAQKIYDTHLLKRDRLLFTGVLKRAQECGDPQLIERLVKTIQTHPCMNTSTKAYIYSKWIDVLCDKEKYEEGIMVVESALSLVKLEDLHHVTLTRLESGVKSTGSTFPYTIPPKKVKESKKAQSSSSSSSSSSSDSDTEKTDKKNR